MIEIVTAELATQREDVKEIKKLIGAARLRIVYSRRKPIMTDKLLPVGYALVAVAEVDTYVMDAIDMKH